MPERAVGPEDPGPLVGDGLERAGEARLAQSGPDQDLSTVVSILASLRLETGYPIG